ncbi:hypothetical protein [Geodermatophilus dictyosporus]|uniref:hypothetical protein n=1 Tax=Geodermatophilus dictyosporus TaxID=1523247 RepID=UPI001B7F775E|nr:hypothetical protein [Geodermatophilus dictyosporus]
MGHPSRTGLQVHLTTRRRPRAAHAAPDGVEALVRDDSGDRMVLVEPRARTPGHLEDQDPS